MTRRRQASPSRKKASMFRELPNSQPHCHLCDGDRANPSGRHFQKWEGQGACDHPAWIPQGQTVSYQADRFYDDGKAMHVVYLGNWKAFSTVCSGRSILTD